MASKQLQPPALRSLYRQLLRELPPRHRLSDRTPLHHALRAHFAPDSSNSSSNNNPEAAAQQAQQYAAYFRAQRTYAALLERYNPGMGMDEEERVRLTARRVGMDLPVEFSGKEANKTEQRGVPGPR